MRSIKPLRPACRPHPCQSIKIMQNSQFKKWTTMAALVFLCSMMNSGVFAKACTNYQNGVEVNVIKASISNFNNIPPFNPGDYIIGQPIGQPITGTMNASSVYSKCPVTYPPVKLHISGVGIPNQIAVQGMGFKNVFNTSMQGIGVVIHMGSNVASYMPYEMPGGIQGTIGWLVNIPITITLVKTGDITAPGLLRGAFLYYREQNPVSGAPLIEFSFSSDIAVTPRVPTCSVANSNQNVQLERINASELGGVNSTSAKQTDFNIQLNCSGGDLNTATRAFVTLTDGIQPGNTGKILTVQQTGLPAGEKPAQGIGLQILKGETVLGYGPDSNAKDNTNQWEAGKVSQGQSGLTIPLQARYVQTASKVTAGKVRARATFTMSYQ